MRIIIHLSREESEAREKVLNEAPDEFTDKASGDLAEVIWNELDDFGDPIMGIDLEDDKGMYLYTIVGEPR